MNRVRTLMAITVVLLALSWAGVGAWPQNPEPPTPFPPGNEEQPPTAESGPRGFQAESAELPESPYGSVYVTSAWTSDGNGSPKTTFSQGDSIRYTGNVYNSNGQSVNAYFTWSRNGPCGSSTLWAGYLTTGTGTWTWYLPGTVPSGCPGNYTFALSVNYDGQTSSRTTAFTITSGSCPNQYFAEYYNNRYLSGNPTFVRCENWPINQNWGTGGPGNGIGNDNFSVRWTGTANINSGTYTFIAVADDGIRVWLDNNLIIDAWRDQPPTEYRVSRSVSSGNHSIKVEYYENGGGAVAQFRWETGNAVVISNKPAFDACRLPLTNEMQTWWTSSPYWEINAYIGGSNRGCNNWNQQHLTAQWVSTVRSQGWNLIPTWVGPQAPCSSYASRISYDPNTAYQEGRTQADAAANAARNLGLTVGSGYGGTIIYYDMEAYSSSNTPPTCRAAVKSFMNGWVSRLHELGNRAGGYGSSCAAFLSDWSSISNVPDDIWPAHWIYNQYNSSATVWNVACINNSVWTNHQRIRQYAGGHNETWGGTTLNIDSDIADGHVAGTNTRGINVGLTEVSEVTNDGIVNQQLVSASDGWVIAGNRLLWTDSIGDQWFDITPDAVESMILRNGFFLNSQHGWLVVGSNPDSEGRSSLSIAHTTDHGVSWRLTSLPFNPADPNSTQSNTHISFLSSTIGWVSIELASSSNFSLGSLFKTLDGGQTWVELPLPIGGPIRFVNEELGWMAGGAAGDELYVTRDGGASWQRQSVMSIQTDDIQQVYYDLPTFYGLGIGVLPVTVVNASKATLELHFSQDSGQSWQLVDTIPIQDGSILTGRVATQILDSQTWIAAQNGASILIDINDSVSRVSLPSGTDQIKFATEQIGWAHVATGTCTGKKPANYDIPQTEPAQAGEPLECAIHLGLLRTTDRGATWREVTP